MQRLTGPDSYTFVLWGEAFKEIPATIFVGELRRAGVRVKIVGLNAQRTTGHFGLKLVPDITLDEALKLVERAICIIIPGDFEQLQQFHHDPRVEELLTRARNNHARVIVGRRLNPSEVNHQPWAFAQKELIEFPEKYALIEFAEQTANSLAHTG
ncbi:MAG: DJ-1/PfpI family protein [Litorilinea sp.]